MDQESRINEIRLAWRALDDNRSNEGWCTIPVSSGNWRYLKAGRHFPGNEEAILVGFTDARLPSADRLPNGRGFLVTVVDLGNDDRLKWVALQRRTSGSLDLFVMMVDDVISIPIKYASWTDEQILLSFLSRIRARHNYMRNEENLVFS